MAFLKKLLKELRPPIRILDLGGTQEFWEDTDCLPLPGIKVVLFNLGKSEVRAKGFSQISGDVRDLSQFGDAEFDIVFSNSLLEHLGGLADQRRAAEEIRRVGRRYFIQTPNLFFPIEPHFVFPFFQFLPKRVQVFFLMHFNLGWYLKQSKKEDACAILSAIRLLRRSELSSMFPDGVFYDEKVFGLTKSFIVYKWNN